MDTDLSFITNEKNQNLKERFRVLIKDTQFFDCLVGYFYSSGFHALYKSLEITGAVDYTQNQQKQAKVKDLENKIDQMVYDLYGLTEDEIKIVEGSLE